MAEQPQARDEGHERDGAFRHRLDAVELAALGIGVEAVDMTAEDETTLVRLREIEELRTPGDDIVDDRLDRLGHEGLQDMAFHGQRHARHPGDVRCMASHRDTHPAGIDAAARSFDAGALAVLHDEARVFNQAQIHQRLRQRIDAETGVVALQHRLPQRNHIDPRRGCSGYRK